MLIPKQSSGQWNGDYNVEGYDLKITEQHVLAHSKRYLGDDISQQEFPRMSTARYKFISVVQCCNFRFTNYEKSFPQTLITFLSDVWIRSTVACFVVRQNVLVFQVLDVLSKDSNSNEIFGYVIYTYKYKYIS